MIKLIKGDCLEKLKNIPDKSVDLVLTDPPYSLDLHGGGKGFLKDRQLMKDRHIKFISDSFDQEVVFSEVKRVCKKVNLVIFCSNKQVSEIMSYWEKQKLSATILVWNKPNPIPASNGKYVSSIEFMIYVREKGATYNSIGYHDQLKVFNYKAPSSKQRIHPTEKPVEMLERLLKIHSSENQVVLDMFMGSGSTGEACLSLGRSFIGIEKDENYFNAAKKRIQEHYLKLRQNGGTNATRT